MAESSVVKSVRQYSAEPVPKEDMEKLLEIAADYRRVKNSVYERYGGRGSLDKLYPGYTVQNEMTACGLRGELKMPSVYYYRAVFEALGDIKSRWTRTKTAVRKAASQNPNLTEEDLHYLRFLLKVNNAFAAVLQGKLPEGRPGGLPEALQAQCDALAEAADTGRVHSYLRRQVRKRQVRLHTEKAEGFGVTERAYRYERHGISLATKQSRKRVFVPLTDSKEHTGQLYVKLYPQEGRIEITAAVRVRVKRHADYGKCVGIALGMKTMLTTDGGERYGEEFGELHTAYAEWLREQNSRYRGSRADNAGRKKYKAKKHRKEERLHSYINSRLNLFLETEKPGKVCMMKQPAPAAGGVNRKINYAVAVWQRGYIRRRLIQKCREQSVEVVEVPGKGISTECSRCGAEGSTEGELFRCGSCGYERDAKANAAANALKRAEAGQIIR